MRLGLLAIIIWAVAAGTLTTCSSDSGPEGECKVDADCPEDEICQSSCMVAIYCWEENPGDCHLICTWDRHLCYGPDADCGQGYFCEMGREGRCGVCTVCEYAERCGEECKDCSAGQTNRRCVDLRCGCLDERNCEEGQTCADSRCKSAGQEFYCDDSIDDDTDGLTDCEDIEDCDLQPCGQDYRCENGTCIECKSISCEHPWDCTGCDRYDSCNIKLGCCTHDADSACP